jgi:uncharacterized membrane protein YqhA
LLPVLPLAVPFLPDSFIEAINDRRVVIKMFARLLVLSRYIMILPVVVTLIGAISLIIYETAVMALSIRDTVENIAISTQAVKMFAIGVVEGIDVFLIAVAAYIISLGLYTLFIDENLDRPRWLMLKDLEDLKANLVSVVIAVLAVLFLREAVGWDGSQRIVYLGVATALIIFALAFYLSKHKGSPP